MNTDKINEIFDKLREIKQINTFTAKLLSSLANEIEASQGAFFVASKKNDINILRLVSGYAYHLPESSVIEFEFGEGLSGQVAKEGKPVNIKNVPDNYINIISGLGHSSPKNLYICPVKIDDKILGVVELASFKEFTSEQQDLISGILEHSASYINELIKVTDFN
ncbi:MAG: GAF domain-containing protein [Bacteroidota bacterium]|nr:GAF domain-containing protein [Bacteroidota bacterium]